MEMRERNRVLLQENARLLEAVDRLKRGAAAAQPSPVRARRSGQAGPAHRVKAACADHHADHA